jgi:hypothetical protein
MASFWKAHSLSGFGSAVCKAAGIVNCAFIWTWSLDSSVSTVTTLWRGRSGSIFQRRISFCLLQSIQTCSGAHTFSCSVGTGVLFAGVRRPGREAHHYQAVSRLRMGGAVRISIKFGVGCQHHDPRRVFRLIWPSN